MQERVGLEKILIITPHPNMKGFDLEVRKCESGPQFSRTKNRRKHSEQHGASRHNDHGQLFVFVTSPGFYFSIFVSKDGSDA